MIELIKCNLGIDVKIAAIVTQTVFFKENVTTSKALIYPHQV